MSQTVSFNSVLYFYSVTSDDEHRRMDRELLRDVFLKKISLSEEYKRPVKTKLFNKYIRSTVLFLDRIVSVGGHASMKVKIGEHRILDVDLYISKEGLVSLYTYCKESFPDYSSNTKWHYFNSFAEWKKIIRGVTKLEWRNHDR